MDAPIHYTEQAPGTHKGGSCTVCGAPIARDETRVQATTRTAAGLVSTFLQHRCHFDVNWLPTTQRRGRRE